LLLLIYILRKAHCFRWVVLVHDVFPENLVAAKIIRRSNLIYKITKFVFDRVYALADRMIVIGRDMKCLMKTKTRDQVKIEYIPNWAPLSDIKLIPRESSIYIGNLNWEGKIVFQFFGNLGRVQGIPNLLQAIKLVKSKNAAFIFMGTGVMSEYLKEFISTYESSNIVYLGGIDPSNKSEALSACDVAIISLSKEMKGLGVPSKAYFSMAADKALLVISDDGSELDRVVEEYSIGWSCESGDSKALARQIDDICISGIPIKKGQVRSIFKDNFSDDISLEKISSVLQGL